MREKSSVLPFIPLVESCWLKSASMDLQLSILSLFLVLDLLDDWLWSGLLYKELYERKSFLSVVSGTSF